MDTVFTPLETTSRDAYRAARDGHPPALAESPALDGATVAEAADDVMDAEILTEHEYAARVATRHVTRIDHTETPGGDERAPATRTAGKFGASGGPVNPLTGDEYIDPSRMNKGMTIFEGAEIVADINRRNAERVQCERGGSGHATVHPMRRALPRGRS